MTVAASRVFSFLEGHDNCSVERLEVASTVFGKLRRSLRQIVVKLRETEDEESLDISYSLRAALSEWLTVPVPFDDTIRETIADIIGGSDAVESRWGSDIRMLYDTALQAAEDMQSEENPIRQRLRAAVRDLRSNNRGFKIYCHRRARPHFESLFVAAGDPPFPVGTFLHSVREYREAEPFDFLLKVGPLRARGWGSAPDALITAPRFEALLQILWSGCSDEPGFGYDPIDPPGDSPAGGTVPTRAGRVRWRVRVARSGEDLGLSPGSEVDELQIFREMDRLGDKRLASLVQIDDVHGILYPAHSRLLSLDPDPAAPQPIDRRIPGDTLVEGLYLMRPLLDEASLISMRAEHGHYSRVWKERLVQARQTDFGLIKKLRAAGLNLVHLEAAVRHWCRPPSTVIHAPQLMRHFKILLTVLGIAEADTAPRQKTAPWWQLAWNEVRRSRGEAIQAGVQEQERIEERLLIILTQLLPAIREKASAGTDFRITMPAGAELSGDVLFHRVWGIEAGFAVPENELRVVRELSVMDRWRD